MKYFPRGLDGGGRAVKANHHHRDQRRHFEANPQEPDVVSRQREVHRAHHREEHRVIEADQERRQLSRFDLVGDIAGAEHRRREADERVQNRNRMLTSSRMK